METLETEKSMLLRFVLGVRGEVQYPLPSLLTLKGIQGKREIDHQLSQGERKRFSQQLYPTPNTHPLALHVLIRTQVQIRKLMPAEDSFLCTHPEKRDLTVSLGKALYKHSPFLPSHKELHAENNHLKPFAPMLASCFS